MRTLLFLAHRAPAAPDRGDRIRSYHVLRHLAARARVHVAAFGEGGDAAPRDMPLASWTVVPRAKGMVRAGAEALATGRSVSEAAFADRRLAAAVARVRATARIDAAYVFSGQMARYAGPEPFVMDFVDVDSAKFAGLARGIAAPLWRREARLLSAFERRTAERAAASLFVSAAEAALFDGPRVRVVENGIDADAFDPDAVAPVGEAGPLIVFAGQMDYGPNIDAAVRFARDVLPLVRSAQPLARLAVVGRAPAPAVRALAGEAVIVTGEVADVRPWVAAAAVCVAPLELARGVQNKVLEAMAMARPVVASGPAAQGIDHAGTIRVADGARARAAAVLDLLADPAGAAAMGRAARARVRARYDWRAALAPLDALLGLGLELELERERAAA